MAAVARGSARVISAGVRHSASHLRRRHLRQLQAELARLRELTGARPAPAEQSREPRTYRQADGE